MIIKDQFGIIQNLQTSTILQTFLSRDFFATSYSKVALDLFHYFYCFQKRSCCKKRQKSPNQETGLGNRGHLKVMNDTKLVLNEHE